MARLALLLTLIASGAMGEPINNPATGIGESAPEWLISLDGREVPLYATPRHGLKESPVYKLGCCETVALVSRSGTMVLVRTSKRQELWAEANAFKPFLPQVFDTIQDSSAGQDLFY